MIRAVYQQGKIQPLDPVPADWTDGEPLAVEDRRESRNEFDRLARQWKTETQFLSSTTAMVTLPPYQRIIGMGERALPWILEELRREPRQWFWALRAITGEDPVPPDAKGNVEAKAAAWLQWASERGYV